MRIKTQLALDRRDAFAALLERYHTTEDDLDDRRPLVPDWPTLHWRAR